jgi:membrane protein
MLFVVLLFMVATVAIPTVQSLLRAGANRLPFDLAHVAVLIYAGSLAFSLAILFACLIIIYSRVPHLKVPWRAVWPGALGATAAIAVIDYAFPAYLTHISTLAHFGTTIVFVLIMLGWFYVVALIILGGAIVNAMRVTPGAPTATEAR